jgi:DNA adenine methylase
LKAPFPYFGGKSSVADLVWSALGDCAHYIEPFCGTCAVLLKRPKRHKARIETVNDADGVIVNVWRALRAAPDEVASWCDWPVNHADLIARKKRLNGEYAGLVESLCADDEYYNAKLAGYYIWAASCWIGHGLIRPNQIPHLSGAGKGVHAAGQRPHITNAGSGVQEPYNLRLYDWFRALSERMRYVRTVCGDWTRVCGGAWQDHCGVCGMFFDPPYSDVAGRDQRCYAVDSQNVAHDVRDWCRARGAQPTYRIVLAGYYDEHASLLDDGWRVHRWSAHGGYGNLGDADSPGKTNRHKESLFMSPHCLGAEALLFDDAL